MKPTIESIVRNFQIPGTKEFKLLEKSLREAEPFAEAIAASEQLSEKDLCIVINTRA